MADRSYAKIVGDLPPAETENRREEISALLESGKIKIVVLDDDPTGIQTVQDCLLLTRWDRKTLELAFRDRSPIFYILTNSRSRTEKEAVRINREIVQKVLMANRDYSFNLIFISRSDSTLRGHFPAEPEAILSVLRDSKTPPDFPAFFIPALFEAGRGTVNNVHYLRTGDRMIPVSETEFAGDSVFGYSNSDLSLYMQEKSGGRIGKGRTGNIPLAFLRQSTLEELQAMLESFEPQAYVSVDALEYADLWKFSLAFLRTFSLEKSPAVLRTSSSLPKALGGIPDRDLLDRKDLLHEPGRGLFIVGSHVRKSTRQLEELLKIGGVRGIEADIKKILDTPGTFLEEVLGKVEDCLDSEATPVVFTSRQEMSAADKTHRLEAGRKISGFLAGIVRSLHKRPSYLVAKGGITSHEILVGGLRVKVARVAGQAIPGVPVILTGRDHAWPSLPYVIFPGNVGDDRSLAELYAKLDRATE